MPMASVKLNVNGRERRGADYGNGPIDAAYNCIAHLTRERSAWFVPTLHR
ncbi:MAG: alpha-isopropylmalate synthase regulatory domain-containing protein [Candidatus Competibacteraceae bacterium]